MSFVVYVDLDNATGPKVHLDTCGVYLRRKPGATTSKWYEDIESYEEAVRIAKSRERGNKPFNSSPSCCSPG